MIFQSAQAAAERIVDLLEVDPEIKDGLQSYDASQIKGNIEFRDATFYYHSEHEMVLNHFNLNIKAGSKIALVGHTGSGKTTIVHLLGRFYELKKRRYFLLMVFRLKIINSKVYIKTLAMSYKHHNYFQRRFFKTLFMENFMPMKMKFMKCVKKLVFTR